MQYLIIFICAYLIGSIPFGYMFGKMKGIDIREHGSGNIGATNVFRTLGKNYGIPCFLLDFAKGFVPAFCVKKFLKNDDLSVVETAAICAAIGSIFGHVFTCFLKFKGGKGVATAAGSFMGLAWFPLSLALGAWIICMFIFRIVSLSSIIAALVPPAIVWIDPLDHKYSLAIKILFSVVGVLVVLRHKANIKRLLKGEEPSFRKKKEQTNPDESKEASK